jgi:hypothetical protein
MLALSGHEAMKCVGDLGRKAFLKLGAVGVTRHPGSV